MNKTEDLVGEDLAVGEDLVGPDLVGVSHFRIGGKGLGRLIEVTTWSSSSSSELAPNAPSGGETLFGRLLLDPLPEGDASAR